MTSKAPIQVAMVVWNTFQNDARVRNEAESLQSAGYSLTVHALNAPGFTRAKEQMVTGVQVQRHGSREGARLIALQNSKKFSGLTNKVSSLLSRCWIHGVILFYLLKSRPDIVHAHDVNVLPTVWLASRLLGIPLVYDAHEISAEREGYRGRRKFIACIEKRLARGAQGVITTTEARAKFFARAYRIVRPLILQNRPRYQKVVANNLIRKNLALMDPWPIILYQGGLQSGRGLENLIESVTKVPECYLVFVGGGGEGQKLQKLAKELQIQERVKFIPTVALDELPGYTASADIGVQPIENTCLNHFTTDSNKLFEYVQAGLPVVASNLPEIRRIVKPNNLGILVPPGKLIPLIEALNELVQNVQKRNFFAQQALAASKFLNWEMQEQQLVDFYNAISLRKNRDLRR